MTEPHGKDAMDAFTTAARLVKAGEYAQALAVNLRRSDKGIIEARIAAAKQAASANTTNGRNGEN